MMVRKKEFKRESLRTIKRVFIVIIAYMFWVKIFSF